MLMKNVLSMIECVNNFCLKVMTRRENFSLTTEDNGTDMFILTSFFQICDRFGFIVLQISIPQPTSTCYPRKQ